MQLTGKIKVIGEIKTFGTNGFTKRDAVITTNEQYPQDILVEFHKDNCAKLDHFKVGDNVDCGINLRGREWINPDGEAKYFNSIVVWKIGSAGQAEQQKADNTSPFE